MRAYEQSQMRLGMNRIDLLVIHDLDFWFHQTEAKVAALSRQLFTSGLARARAASRRTASCEAIGAGINELGMMPRFLDMLDLDFFLVALRYTLLEQETLEANCPIASAAMSASSSAACTIPASPRPARCRAPNTITPTRQPEILERVRRIEAVCKRHDVPLPAAALQFPLGHPSVASVIPGAIHPDQVAQNVRNFAIRSRPRSGRT